MIGILNLKTIANLNPLLSYNSSSASHPEFLQKQIRALHHQAALDFLNQSEFPVFDLNQTEKISTQVAELTKSEASSILIHPLTGKFTVTHFNIHQTSLDDYEKQFFKLGKLIPVRCGLYQIKGETEEENIWTNKILPIMGKEIYSATGEAMSDQQIEAMGLEKIKDTSGQHLSVNLLVSGGRVAAIPGPWVVPYIETGEGIKLLTRYSQLTTLAGYTVNASNIKKTLLSLAEQKKIKLKLGSDLEFKGAGCYRLTKHAGASQEVYDKYAGQSVYIPGDQYDQQGMGVNAITNSGIGAANESLARVLEMENYYRQKGAVFLGDTVTAQKLFDSETLPELKKQTAYREVWYGMRMSYGTLRSSSYAQYIQHDGFEVYTRDLLKPLLKDIFSELDEAQAMDTFLKLSAIHLAKSIRAFFEGKVSRELSSNIPDNYGFFSEIIDTDSDSLGPQNGPRPYIKDQMFLQSWIERRLVLLTEIGRQHTRQTINAPYFLQYFLPTLIKKPEHLQALLTDPRLKNIVSIEYFPWDKVLKYLEAELNDEKNKAESN